ncbi:MAG: O-antigen ligase family protein [Anaerolineae bacterium]|nr:O-antigen ligase family protein [Anaerolineae bacterium]MDQ7036800.1 O-antigen ligase family protein [Anaerolineae bacterium]
MIQFKRYRQIPVQISILITLFLSFAWIRWSHPPAPFTANYVMGFVISRAMLVTIILWMVFGFYGLSDFIKSKWRLLWAASLLVLLGWMTISQTWAFGLEDYSGLAPNAVLQFALVTLFAITVACASPPPRVIVSGLIISLVLHGIIGNLQVMRQSSIGLTAWGEIVLDPNKSGISVIQSGAVRWLRPYGLLPHPNIYAGVITVSLLSSIIWVLSDHKKRWIGMGVFGFGFWILLLTFSRGAWVGFAAGALFALPFMMRRANFWKRILPIIGLSVLVGIVFIAMFRPLLLSRVGVGEEGIELRSISDRLVYNQIARQAIIEYPFHGIGAGNFPWYASVYIFYNTDYDLRGDNVHNIYLGILSELGVIGFSLFTLTFSSPIIAALKQRDTERIALLAGVIAFAVIGLVDHYPMTLIHTQALWFSLLSVAISPQVTNSQA